ncbi:MAG: MFS transporter, partial [Planctomycetota bacterium]
MGEVAQGSGGGGAQGDRKFLLITCFVALVATSFAFIIRIMLMGDWQVEFGLSETEKGAIFGAGMWPFGLSIVLFSLVIDRIGYGKSMIFAFACHALSTVLLFTAGWGIPGYWALYLGSILNGLAAGTVEAVINPAIASAYPKAKTKWLTILHAGWPGGFVLGGIMALLLGSLDVSWRLRVFLVLI